MLWWRWRLASNFFLSNLCIHVSYTVKQYDKVSFQRTTTFTRLCTCTYWKIFQVICKYPGAQRCRKAAISLLCGKILKLSEEGIFISSVSMHYEHILVLLLVVVQDIISFVLVWPNVHMKYVLFINKYYVDTIYMYIICMNL